MKAAELQCKELSGHVEGIQEALRSRLGVSQNASSVLVAVVVRLMDHISHDLICLNLGNYGAMMYLSLSLSKHHGSNQSY